MDDLKTIITIYAPSSLVKQVTELAQERGESRNRFVVKAIVEAVKVDESPDPGDEAEKKSPKR